VDPLDFLLSLERLGMKFGLENMMRLCEALDHPERSFQSVIVAGTNGKGSVTAMTSAALDAAGHRAARYTSPHLIRLEERFVVSEREVDSGELRRSAGVVQGVVERLVQERVLESFPTFFECTTAMAFELFRRAGVEIAVLEVGLGGRLDATNVVTPIAAAITSIDFDHQDLLGGTLEAIAREKAGVIKRGIPVVFGSLPDEAAKVVVSTCRERGASAIAAADRVRASSRVEAGDTIATFETAERRMIDVRLALRGRHQVSNAVVALSLMEVLTGIGVGIPDESMLRGLTDARWPARLERFRWREADVLLDAAHNPAGARAVADYLADAGWDEVTLVFGAMRDKDIAGMLSALLPRSAAVICTTADNPRAAPADELADVAARLSTAASTSRRRRVISAIAEPRLALTEACTPHSRVVVTGSIFLTGPLRGILQ
jgi:dihydrofolate synthase/folylpolyglutamate synthase